jgi:hypothetical protein
MARKPLKNFLVDGKILDEFARPRQENARIAAEKLNDAVPALA